MRTLRAAACPFCGATLLFDDEQQAISHAVPTCDRFRQVMVEVVGEPDEVQTQLIAMPGAPIGGQPS